MLNWFCFHQINHQIDTTIAKKHLAFYMIGSLLVLIMGTWALFYILKIKGIYPLQRAHSLLERQQSAIFHPCVDYWEKEIFAWAAEVELDPLLIATVMQIESCGNPNAVSPVGALGLFQVMPYHFLPGDDPLDPQTNAQRGLDYLQESFIKSNGDIRTALAGYNGGHGQINRDPEVWPDETKRYVHWGWGIYQDARDNNITGKALSDWLDAGGWHLCEQAKLTLGLP